MESAASGIIAGINAVRRAKDAEPVVLPQDTEIGALLYYITDKTVEKFQPMGANLGILPELVDRPRDKKLRAQAYADRALESLEKYIEESDVNV